MNRRGISIDTILHPGHAAEKEARQFDSGIAHLDRLLASIARMSPEQKAAMDRALAARAGEK